MVYFSPPSDDNPKNALPARIVVRKRVGAADPNGLPPRGMGLRGVSRGRRNLCRRRRQAPHR